MFSITAISEMWVKTTLIYQYTPIRMIKWENCGNTKCWQGCRETRSLKQNSGSVKRYLYSEEKKKPVGSDGKESACNVGDPDSVPGLGRSPGEGNGNSLQYPCLKNSMDRGTRPATVYGVAKSQTQLSDWIQTHTHSEKKFSNFL